MAQRLREAGWHIVNIDATVVAEAPETDAAPRGHAADDGGLSGHRADRVSVKATTSEKMGFVGRREGMEATAIATLIKSDFQP